MAEASSIEIVKDADSITPLSIQKAVEVLEGLKHVSSEEQEEAIADLKRHKSQCVMACGLTGTGKSSLLNGLCGEKAFEVGHIKPTTEKVVKHVIEKESCTLILCDTPGFDDESGNEDEYLEEIGRECVDVDTLLYCTSVNATRIRMEKDLSTLQLLYSALDKKVWNHCVIVLTFANTLIDRIEAGGMGSLDKVKQAYYQSIAIWEESVVETFRKAGIDPSKMPVIHAGATITPLLFPTDEQPWLSILLESVMDASPSDRQAVLFSVNIDRLQYSLSCHRELPLHRQQLVVKKDTFLRRLEAKFPSIAVTLATGSFVGISGASIGVVVGAVAVGVPTFGIGAGLGALLGGVIGGGIGLGIGAAANKMIQDDLKPEET